jgi:sporulation protein YlmC with PRC-barrel domain
MRFSDAALRGRTVISAEGRALGQVAGFELDSEDWRLSAITVDLSSDIADELGAPRSLFHKAAMSIPAGQLSSVGDAVLLRASVAQLRARIAGASGERS